MLIMLYAFVVVLFSGENKNAGFVTWAKWVRHFCCCCCVRSVGAFFPLSKLQRVCRFFPGSLSLRVSMHCEKNWVSIIHIRVFSSPNDTHKRELCFVSRKKVLRFQANKSRCFAIDMYVCVCVLCFISKNKNWLKLKRNSTILNLLWNSSHTFPVLPQQQQKTM